jgi:hypothetical protein
VIGLTFEQAVNVRYRSTKGHALVPRRLADNSHYCVPDAAATDTSHAAVSSVLGAGTTVTPVAADFAADTEFTGAFGSRLVTHSSAKVARALSSPAPGVFRFELQANDFSSLSDASSNGNRRSELTDKVSFSAGDEVWQSWSFVVGAQHDGLLPTGSQGIIMQMHSVDDHVPVGRTPPLTVDCSEGLVKLITRSSAELSTDGYSGVLKLRWSDALPAVGVVTNIVLHSIWGASGHLDAWVNGVSVFSGDIPLGYYAEAPAMPLATPHYGLYTHAASTTDVMYLANLEWGSADLSARVSSPLPVPDLAPWN